jgi:hypothetical protein
VTKPSTPYRTRNFRALDFDFTVETDHAALAHYLDSAFAALATGDDASHVVTLNVEAAGSEPQLMIDGETLIVPPDSTPVLPALMSAVNRAVVDASADRLLVHASAVEADGRALLFPAPMEAGKSTLAAGLLRAGYSYVTDEAVAIDLTTLEVQPYPRPISLDRGSWPLFADLRPATPNGVDRFCTEQWHVSPLSVRPDAVAQPSHPGVVAFPAYEPERRTRARRMPRAQALCELVACTFNVERLGTTAFDALARVMAACRCYRLTVGDLDAACAAVDRMVGDLDPPDALPDALVVTEPTDAASYLMSGDTVDASFAVARRPGVAWALLDRVVVYDPDTGRVVRLNDSGSLLWQVLDGETPLGDLAAELSDAYGSDRHAVETDVVAMARRLARLGLLAQAAQPG